MNPEPYYDVTARIIQSDTAYVPDSEDLDSDSEDLELTSDESETSITLITEEDEVSMLSVILAVAIRKKLL